MVSQTGFTDIKMVMRISLTLDLWKVIMVVEWDPEKYCHSGIDSALGLKKMIPKGARPKLILTDPPYNLGNFMKKRATNLSAMRSNHFSGKNWDKLTETDWTA